MFNFVIVVVVVSITVADVVVSITVAVVVVSIVFGVVVGVVDVESALEPVVSPLLFFFTKIKKIELEISLEGHFY